MTRPTAFVSYDLRTTDLDAAEAFYPGLLGWQVQRGGGSRVLLAGAQRVGELVALPERARAQGAPAHWLGLIGVDDVEAAAQHFLALGAQRLGPAQQGARVAALKDAQGAVFGLSTQEARAPTDAVVWHQLNTTDLESAWRSYATLLGWRVTQTLELGPPVGAYRMFGWGAEERSVGGMVNTARLPGIHTHWLFYFAVADLDAAVERVRSLGGRVTNGPMQVPGGDRVAACEDPQGAAFALSQSARGH